MLEFVGKQTFIVKDRSGRHLDHHCDTEAQALAIIQYFTEHDKESRCYISTTSKKVETPSEHIVSAIQLGIDAFNALLPQIAGELCSEEHVNSSAALIRENGGTLAYVTITRQLLESALEKAKESRDVFDDFVKCDAIILKIESGMPGLEGAFTGTVSERLFRVMKAMNKMADENRAKNEV